MSLQSRLMIVMSTVLCVLLTAVLLISYDKGVHEVEEFLDGQLALSTRLIDAQIQGMLQTGTPVDSEHVLVEMLQDDNRGEYEPELAFKVWDSRHRLLLQSSNALDMPRLSLESDQKVTFSGRQWLVSVYPSQSGSYVIQTAHPLDTRNAVGLDVMWRVIAPLLVGIPLLLVMVYFAIKKMFQPVSLLGKRIGNRSVTDTEPIPLDDVIDELKPLIRSFNGLLERINQSMRNEQQFTANAAHELRSPIAGIKVQAQVAALSTDVHIKNKSVNQILLGIQRCERLINQMLRLARLDPDHPETLKLDAVHARLVIQDAIDAAAYILNEREQQLVYDCSESDVVVLVDRELMATALSNLLENASKYSPVGSTITVRFSCDETHACFVISDQGPGIEPAQVDLLMQRFARGQDTNGQTGAGLGLAIVDKIIKLHHGSFELKPNSDVGLSARACVPAIK